MHPENAELINKNVSKILDYADCRRAVTGSGMVTLEEYIDRLTVKNYAVPLKGDELNERV